MRFQPQTGSGNHGFHRGVKRHSAGLRMFLIRGVLAGVAGARGAQAGDKGAAAGVVGRYASCLLF